MKAQENSWSLDRQAGVRIDFSVDIDQDQVKEFLLCTQTRAAFIRMVLKRVVINKLMELDTISRDDCWTFAFR